MANNTQAAAELSVSQLKLLVLLEKMEEVVRFMSDEDLKSLYVYLADVCEKGLSRKRKAMEDSSFSQQSLQGLVGEVRSMRPRLDVCKCDFFHASCLEGLKELKCCQSKEQDGRAGSSDSRTCKHGCSECMCSTVNAGSALDLFANDEVFEEFH